MHSHFHVSTKRRNFLVAHNAFEISSISKKLTDNINYSEVNLSQTDTLYQEVRYLYNIMKILSLFPMFTDEKTGRYEFRFLSLQTLYMILAFVVATFALNVAFQEGTKVTSIPQSSSTFDNAIFSYLFYSIHALHLLPLITFYESKKKADYQTQWSLLQAKYALTTGKNMTLKLRRRVAVMLFSAALGCCFLLIMHYFFYASMCSKIDISVSGFIILALYNSYQILVLFCAIGHWAFTARALHQMSIQITSEIKVLIDRKWMKNLSAFESLWLDSYKLLRSTGEAFCFTLLFLLLLLFVLSIIGIYSAFAKVSGQNDLTFLDIAPFFFSAFVLFFLSLISSCPDEAVKALGEDFQIVLLQVKLTSLSNENKKDLCRFLRTVSGNKPCIDLGGYVTINKSLSTSMISTMVTYLVVLLQFRFSTPQSS